MVEIKVIVGKMQAGKDTCAEYLSTNNNNTHIIKFADPLYQCQHVIYLGLGLIDYIKNPAINCYLATDQFRFYQSMYNKFPPMIRVVRTIYYICGLNPDEAEKDKVLIDFLNSDWEGKGDDPNKDRKLLQFIGTEWGRNTIDPDIWVNLMKRRLEKINDLTGGTFICTDCRFPNEWEVLESFGATFYKVIRMERDRIASGAKNLNHPSETSLDSIPDCRYKKIFNNYSSLELLYRQLDEEFSTI